MATSTRRPLLLVPVIVALAGIAALVASSLHSRASGGASRTFLAREYAPAAGSYDVVLMVTGGPSAQTVAVSVTGARERVVQIPEGGSTSFAVRTSVERGPVVVRAVGARFRPNAKAELYDPETNADAGAVAPGQPADTRLVWSDEFNGPAGSPPSASTWIRDTGPYGAPDRELEYYSARRANVSLDGHGNLAIVARQQTTRANGATWHFTSGRLETLGLFSARYGLVEARIKIPAGFGLWSSFWMLGDNFATVGWPKSGEIDVMETLGQYPFTARSTIHGPAGASSYSRGQDFLSTSSLADRFHTYAISWRPNAITWLIDRVPYATVTPADLAPGERWVFNHPFHLMLNLAVGGEWPGPPNSFTPFPATMLVDWVRVYQ